MSHNTFGHLFRVTTWGESHGPQWAAWLMAARPNIPLTEADIQGYLDKRRPGQSSSPRSGRSRTRCKSSPVCFRMTAPMAR